MPALWFVLGLPAKKPLSLSIREISFYGKPCSCTFSMIHLMLEVCPAPKGNWQMTKNGTGIGTYGEGL